MNSWPSVNHELCCIYTWALAFIYTIFLRISMYIYTYNANEFGLYIDIILYLCIYIITYILILYIAIFCHAASLKKNIWPCGDSNLSRRSQSTDILCSRVKTIMRKLRYSSIDYIYIYYLLLFIVSLLYMQFFHTCIVWWILFNEYVYSCILFYKY